MGPRQRPPDPRKSPRPSQSPTTGSRRSETPDQFGYHPQLTGYRHPPGVLQPTSTERLPLPLPSSPQLHSRPGSPLHQAFDPPMNPAARSTRRRRPTTLVPPEQQRKLDMAAAKRHWERRKPKEGEEKGTATKETGEFEQGLTKQEREAEQLQTWEAHRAAKREKKEEKMAREKTEREEKKAEREERMTRDKTEYGRKRPEREERKVRKETKYEDSEGEKERQREAKFKIAQEKAARKPYPTEKERLTAKGRLIILTEKEEERRAQYKKAQRASAASAHHDRKKESLIGDQLSRGTTSSQVESRSSIPSYYSHLEEPLDDKLKRVLQEDLSRIGAPNRRYSSNSRSNSPRPESGFQEYRERSPMPVGPTERTTVQERERISRARIDSAFRDLGDDESDGGPRRGAPRAERKDRAGKKPRGAGKR